MTPELDLSAQKPDFQLGERQVHVWVVPLDDPEKKRRRELAHLAEGILLASYLGVTPAMLEFERGPGGKPRLREEPLQFNLSHSERLALLALALGDKEGSIAFLNQAVEDREAELIWIGVDPRFDSIRETPAFQELAVTVLG